MNDEISVNNSTNNRDSSSPSNANQSFVKNVATRVSGLIPKSISNWFKPQDNGMKRNGSAVLQDSNEFSSDEESSASLYPPRKKLCINQNEFLPSISNLLCREVLRESSPFSESDITQPKPGSSGFSGYNSYNKEFDKFVSKNVSQQPKFTDETFTMKRKSLLFPRNNMQSPNRTETFSSNMIQVSPPSKLISTPSGSPFYQGKTMYGGAGAHSLNNTLIKEPNIVTRKRPIVTPALNSDDNTMSQEAKRILEVLENCSSPVNESKQLPSLSLFSGVKGDKTFTPDHSYNQKPHFLQDLYVPNIPSLLSIKRAKLIDSTLAARQIVASKSSSEGYPYRSSRDNLKQQAPNSAKTQRLAIRRTDKKNIELEIEPPLKLPKSVLQVDSSKLPTFNFQSCSAQNASTQKSVQDSSASKGKTLEPSTKESPFNFTSPEKILKEKLSSQSHKNEFRFSLPQKHGKVDTIEMLNSNSKTSLNKNNKTFVNRIDFQLKCDSEKSLAQSSNISLKASDEGSEKFAVLLKKQSEKWDCKGCMTRNELSASKCICCEEPKQKDNQATDSGFQNIIKDQQAKWECKSCMTRNSSDKEKCVCCEGPNPNLPLSADTGFLNIVKQQSSKWECPSCMTRNDIGVQKCVCCKTANPNNPVAQDSTFTSIVNEQKNKWECKSCMTRNDYSVLKCICCESLNPNTPVSKDSSFTAIIKDQKSKWECKSCMTRNEPTALKCVCCEVPAPHLNESSKSSSIETLNQPIKTLFNSSPSSQFKFGIQPRLPLEIKKDSLSKPEVEVIPKVPEPEESKFSFGISTVKKDSSKDPAEQKITEGTKTLTFGVLNKTDSSAAPSNTPVTASPATASATPTISFPLASLKAVTSKSTETENSLSDLVSKVETTNTSTMTISFPSVTLAPQSVASSTIVTTLPSISSIQTNSSMPGDQQHAPKPATTVAVTQDSSDLSSFSSFSSPQTTSSKPAQPAFTFGKPPENTPVFSFAKLEYKLSADGPVISRASPAPIDTERKFIFYSGNNNKSLFNMGGVSKNETIAATPTEPAFSLQNDTVDSAKKLNAVPSFTTPLFGFGGATQSKDDSANKFNFNLNKSSEAPFTFGAVKPAEPVAEKKPEPPSLFGIVKPPENMFGASNPTNVQTPSLLFGQPTAASEAPKPLFGATAQTFGSNATPMFGTSMVNNNANYFGSMNNQNASENKPPTLFGAPQADIGPTLFGAKTDAPTQFGQPATNQSFAMTPQPKFELPQMNSTPAFNFGSQAASTPNFGFTGFAQNPTVQSGVYTFGASPGGPVQNPANMAFSIGTFPGTPQSAPVNRKLKKVLRRNPR